MRLCGAARSAGQLEGEGCAINSGAASTGRCDAGVYYVELGVVLFRAYRNDDRRARRLALLVLAGNELWNVAFFGGRSPRNGFFGILLFLGPLLRLQMAVSSDRPSLVALTPYS